MRTTTAFALVAEVFRGEAIAPAERAALAQRAVEMYKAESSPTELTAELRRIRKVA